MEKPPRAREADRGLSGANAPVGPCYDGPLREGNPMPVGQTNRRAFIAHISSLKSKVRRPNTLHVTRFPDRLSFGHENY
jgi:hypothetical protein